MMRLAVVGALALSMAACASTKSTYMGYEVINMPFDVAGGETIVLAVTEAGPIPAEDKDFKVEAAGFSIGPSKSEQGVAELIWAFSISKKYEGDIASILVEEIAPSDTAKTVLAVEAPKFKDGMWMGRVAPVPASRESTPWLFEPDVSIFVYRFTIRSANGEEVTLNQPAWFSAQTKAFFQQQVNGINGRE